MKDCFGKWAMGHGSCPIGCSIALENECHKITMDRGCVVITEEFEYPFSLRKLEPITDIHRDEFDAINAGFKMEGVTIITEEHDGKPDESDWDLIDKLTINTNITILTPKGKTFTANEHHIVELGCLGTWVEDDQSCVGCPMLPKCKSIHLAVVILEES